MLYRLVPLALRYCEVGKGVVSKFDKGVLADMCEPLVPVLEGCYLSRKCFCEECCSIGGWIGDPLAEAIDDGAMYVELVIRPGIKPSKPSGGHARAQLGGLHARF